MHDTINPYSKFEVILMRTFFYVKTVIKTLKNEENYKIYQPVNTHILMSMIQ